MAGFEFPPPPRQSPIALRSSTYGKITGALGQLAREQAGATQRGRLRRFRAKLVDKQLVVPTAGITLVEYAWRQVFFNRLTGTWQDAANGFTSERPSDPPPNDNFGAPAFNLADMSTLRSSPVGVGIIEDEEPIVEIMLVPLVDDEADGDSYVRLFWYQDPQDIWSAKITAVTGATNATYDAEAIANPEVSVTNATPVDRLLTNGVYPPKSVNDDEGVRIQRLADGSFVLLANESIGNATCVPGGVAAAAGTVWINAADSSEISNQAAVEDFDIKHVLPADTVVEGNLYRVTAIGELDVNTSTDSVGFQLRLDNTAIHTVTAKRPSGDDRRFCLKWLIDIRTAGEVFVTCAESQVGTADGYEISAGPTAFTDSQDNDLEIAVDWGAASANNVAKLNTFLVEGLL